MPSRVDHTGHDESIASRVDQSGKRRIGYRVAYRGYFAVFNQHGPSKIRVFSSIQIVPARTTRALETGAVNASSPAMKTR